MAACSRVRDEEEGEGGGGGSGKTGGICPVPARVRLTPCLSTVTLPAGPSLTHVSLLLNNLHIRAEHLLILWMLFDRESSNSSAELIFFLHLTSPTHLLVPSCPLGVYVYVHTHSYTHSLIHTLTLLSCPSLLLLLTLALLGWLLI